MNITDLGRKADAYLQPTFSIVVREIREIDRKINKVYKEQGILRKQLTGNLLLEDANKARASIVSCHTAAGKLRVEKKELLSHYAVPYKTTKKELMTILPRIERLQAKKAELKELVKMSDHPKRTQLTIEKLSKDIQGLKKERDQSINSFIEHHNKKFVE